jgi:hypothetical protein
MDDPSATDPEPATFDPTRRRLCADGACVGVIGADGRCGECGRTEAQATAGEEPELRGSRDLDAGPEATDGAAADEASVAAEGFDPKRRLCDDGACVGVIGDDGACRVCGRRASQDPADDAV